jgi:quercetin dioxygenase-like cupin family protein
MPACPDEIHPHPELVDQALEQLLRFAARRATSFDAVNERTLPRRHGGHGEQSRVRAHIAQIPEPRGWTAAPRGENVDAMTDTKSTVLQPPDQADVLAAAGGTIAVRLRSEQTAGNLAVIEMEIPGGMDGLPLHTHPQFDEAFYLIAGSLTFRAGEQVMTAEPGALVYIPGEVAHTFAEMTGCPARVLLWVTPAGHERYFEAMQKALASGETLSPTFFSELMREHGITPVQANGRS